MLEYGTDPSEESPCPLFASIVDSHEHRATTHLIPPPPGIRSNDFPWAGSSLEHEVPFLEVLYALTGLTGDSRYAEAADAALSYYTENAPHPATGLLPWGVHAQWSFYSRRALPNGIVRDPHFFLAHDYITHEQGTFVPRWFWQAMWDRHPGTVLAHVRGLDRHIINKDTFEHNRHAPLTAASWHGEHYAGPGKDFARTAGFLIFDAIFAYAKSRDSTFLDWARRLLAYHLSRRRADGVIKGCIRTPAEAREAHHHSLSLCVHDAAQLLGPETVEGREYMAAAQDLLDAGLKQLPEAVYLGDDLGLRDDELGSAWKWGYGRQIYKPLMATVWSQLYARTGAQIYADLVADCARWQMRAPAPPGSAPVLPYAFWANLVSPVEAFVLTGETEFLDRASSLAHQAVDRLAHDGLLTGAANLDYFGNMSVLYSVCDCVGATQPGKRYYLNSTGTPHFLRSLLRLALIEEGEEDVLGMDVHLRIA